MAEIKWIKLAADMFENRKIKYLRTLPNGNDMVLVWVMLLTMAGRCNAGGNIFITEKLPYTDKMLAEELRVKEALLAKALGELEALGMIERPDGGLRITGWNDHQNVDGMERVREQTRQRVQRHRENSRQSGEM